MIIGLTIVAAGTSLPEGATSLMAAVRGEHDIAIGNAIGSNLFNLLLVLGLATVLTPGGLLVKPGVLAFDLPVMVMVALLCWPILFTHQQISRWEGWLLLGYYGIYITYLVLSTAETPNYQNYRFLLSWATLPLLMLPLFGPLIAQLRHWRSVAK